VVPVLEFAGRLGADGSHANSAGAVLSIGKMRAWLSNSFANYATQLRPTAK